MTSEVQIATNRNNSLKSTGPKTIDGKTRASHNALKHGVLSCDLIIMGEKRHDLEALASEVHETLCPQGAIEELLVEKIINAIWRSRRLTRVESEVLSERDLIFDRSCLSHGFCGSNGARLHLLSRYEANLERILYRALHELQRVQGMRLGHHILAPVAVDVNGEGVEEIGFVS
jgi:hypothetical protein